MECLSAWSRAWTAAAATAAALLTSAQAQPSAVLIDLESGQTILSEEASLQIKTPAAVPMMTLYTALSLLEASKTPLEAPLELETTSRKAAPQPVGRGKNGKGDPAPQPEKPNAAADALLAMAVGADKAASQAIVRFTSSDEQAFTAKMNELAQKLHLQSTHFTSPFADKAAESTTSAIDAARLAQALYADFPQVKLWTSETSASFAGREIPNTNPFLSRSVCGVSVAADKNSDNAVVLAEDQKPNGRVRRLLAVVLDAADRKDLRERIATTLLRGWRDYEAVVLYRAGDVVENIPVYKGSSNTVAAKIESDIIVTLPKERLLELKGGAVDLSVERWAPVVAPVRSGEVLGTLIVSAEGEVLKAAPLTAAESVGRGNFLERLTDNIRLAFENDERRRGAAQSSTADSSRRAASSDNAPE